VFKAPTPRCGDLRREREEFETFGCRRPPRGRRRQGNDSHVESWDVMDDWRLLDESDTGCASSGR
jgi:hypothetical protein